MALKKDETHNKCTVYSIWIDVSFSIQDGFFTNFGSAPKIGVAELPNLPFLTSTSKNVVTQGGMAPFVAQNMELIQAMP